MRAAGEKELGIKDLKKTKQPLIRFCKGVGGGDASLTPLRITI